MKEEFKSSFNNYESLSEFTERHGKQNYNDSYLELMSCNGKWGIAI